MTSHPNPLTVRAPYNPETAISLLSAAVGTLNTLTLTDAEKERVRSILERMK